jgi:hypothetical protein
MARSALKLLRLERTRSASDKDGDVVGAGICRDEVQAAIAIQV